MMLSNCWHVRLGEGARRMTDSQVHAAAARCWIDKETPVRKPRTSEWTKLGDAAPAKRIAEERVIADIDTSAMILVSGEFELVEDGEAPTRAELASARPPSLAPKLFLLGLAMLAGGLFVARAHFPRLDAELHSLAAAVEPAPIPVPAPAPAPVAVATKVTSSATLTHVPKMPAPVTKMREPVPPRSIDKAPVQNRHGRARSARTSR